jgi:hypothetical protein
MYCSNCGAILELGYAFCPKCGHKVHNAMPPIPRAPSPPPMDDPEEDGDEAVLYRKSNSSYFTARTTWVSGSIVLTRSYLVFYLVHFIKTFRIFYRDIDAVADAFSDFDIDITNAYIDTEQLYETTFIITHKGKY